MKYLFLFLLVCSQVVAQEINTVDGQGKKHGLWKGTYADTGRPRYEGTFDHGKETGVFKFYDNTKDGNVRSNQLTNNQSVPMITSPVQNTTVVLGSGTVDIQDSASNLARVFQADIQCSNGVIHGVQRVLQPQL